MNRYPLCGLDKFKTFVKDTGTTNNVLYQDLIDRSSRQIEKHCKRNIRSRSYTEYQDGDGNASQLFLKQWPVVGTTADVDLYDDVDRVFSATYKFADDDWVLDNDQGIVELLSDSSIGSMASRCGIRR